MSTKTVSAKRKYLIVAIIILVILTIIFYLDSPNLKKISRSAIYKEATSSSQQESGLIYVSVKRVIDGDTIELINGEIVRYIGIDSPESENTIECYNQEATKINQDLVEGKIITLSKDISDKDKYGRLLRYVYIKDIFVNEYLIKNGYAKIFTVPPDIRFKDIFKSAQNYAQENNLGLWDKCF